MSLWTLFLAILFYGFVLTLIYTSPLIDSVKTVLALVGLLILLVWISTQMGYKVPFGLHV